MQNQPSFKIVLPKPQIIEINGITYTFNFRNVIATQGDKIIYEQELFSQPKINPILEKDVQEEYIIQVTPTKDKAVLLITTNANQLLLFDTSTKKITKK